MMETPKTIFKEREESSSYISIEEPLELEINKNTEINIGSGMAKALSGILKDQIISGGGYVIVDGKQS